MSTSQNLDRKQDTYPEVPTYIFPNKLTFGQAYDSTPSRVLDAHLSTADSKEAIHAPKYPLASSILNPLRGRFRLLQLWEGKVLNVTDTEFEALISDKTNPDLPDEIVTIDIDELSPDDVPLTRPGSVFYWSVGYVDFPGRGRIRESKIRFRRLRGWTTAEIQSARETGKRLEALFD